MNNIHYFRVFGLFSINVISTSSFSMGCGASTNQQFAGDDDVLAADGKTIEMREWDSVSDILHFPDRDQQLLLLKEMHQQLGVENPEESVRRERKFSHSRLMDQSKSELLAPSIPEVLVDSPLFDDGEEKNDDMKNDEGEMNDEKKDDEKGKGKSPLNEKNVVSPYFVKSQLDFFGHLVKLIQNQQELIANGSPQNVRGYPDIGHNRKEDSNMKSDYPESLLQGIQQNSFSRFEGPSPHLTMSSPQAEYNLDLVGPRLEAYRSGIVEPDSVALARLLKKHFNNFVLECEFNASGNSKAFEILRLRRCDKLSVDNALSAGHNITSKRVKHIADMFIQYAMTIVDAQGWGGQLRFAVKRKKDTGSSAKLAVIGTISYLTSDRTVKFEAPYQVEADFVLQKT